MRFLRRRGSWPTSGKYDAIVCIGCLLRGDTLHYDVIANEVTRGIGQSAQETGVPHAFGVLTCDTLEQAIDRAGLKAGNKGYEAGLAAVEMASLHDKLQSQLRAPLRGNDEQIRHTQKVTRTRVADAVSARHGQADDRRRAQDFLERAQATWTKKFGALRTICFAWRRSVTPEIDQLIEKNAEHWRMDRMAAVDRNVSACGDRRVPGISRDAKPVVINEALEIARRFSTPESVTFINGVLDSVARELGEAK